MYILYTIYYIFFENNSHNNSSLVVRGREVFFVLLEFRQQVVAVIEYLSRELLILCLSNNTKLCSIHPIAVGILWLV